MRFTELQALMQAVLDGEATPAEAAELERRLAADAVARADFDELKRLFDDLAAVPRKHPPEGLVAAVTAALPGIAQTRSASSQLSPASRVLEPYSDGSQARGDGPMQQEHQHATLPPQRSFTMTQPHPPYSAKRKAWIGAGIALVAVAIVVRFGFDSVPKSEDVAGTVVPAQRYRAPQAGGDIQLGDQTVAQLMQNDAFVKLIRDPEIQAMARDPNFAAAAQFMLSNPELAKVFATNADLAKALTAKEMAHALEQNAQAMQRMKLAADEAQRLVMSVEAQKAIAADRAIAQYVSFLAEAANAGPWRVQMDKANAAELAAMNASFAKRFIEYSAAAEHAMKNAAVEKKVNAVAEMKAFRLASAEAAQYAAQYAQAANYLAQSRVVAQLSAEHFAAAQSLMARPEAARLIQNSAAMQVLMANPSAAVRLLSSPEATRVMQNPEAAQRALAAAAERNVVDLKAGGHSAAERNAVEKKIQ